MNDLINVKYDSDRPTISGRELHLFLDVKERYTQWFARMCDYGFIEHIDYMGFSENTEKPQGGRPSQDHQLTIEMAKELCMLQRTEKGKQARQYFIQLEKEWNSPTKVMARALKFADERIQSLQLETKKKDQLIGELMPKADYTDRILQNNSLVNINQIAKDYGMSAKGFNKVLYELGVQYNQGGQWLLYSKHQGKGYTSSETFEFTHRNGMTDVKMRTKWTQKGRLFLYKLLKEHGILPLIEKDSKIA